MVTVGDAFRKVFDFEYDKEDIGDKELMKYMLTLMSRDSMIRDSYKLSDWVFEVDGNAELNFYASLEYLVASFRDKYLSDTKEVMKLGYLKVLSDSIGFI